MLNEILARHYGVDGVSGEAMRRVPLKPGDHRGGLLTQAAILGLTSDGTRHRPVHRGKWVLESIYGNPPPPPPPNVAAIKPTPPNEKKTSLRAKIERTGSSRTAPGAIARSTHWAWRSTSTTPSAAGGPSRTYATGPAPTP